MAEYMEVQPQASGDDRNEDIKDVFENDALEEGPAERQDDPVEEHDEHFRVHLRTHSSSSSRGSVSPSSSLQHTSQENQVIPELLIPWN